MNVFDVLRGDSPIVLGQPHGGTFVPEEIHARLNANGQALADTDWHITRLYDGLLDGATVVRSNIHRYVIDANRDPEGVSLYPGQNTTTLVPLTDFDGQEIWDEGQHPSEDEVEDRRQTYHAPYHAALQAELDRVRDRHGVAILFDCHSIRSQIPFLFDGVLPDFSIGTNLGATCAPTIEAATLAVCADADGYSSVTNGRFKGGWTTRHYGQPETGIHAIQMELAQRTYMDEAAPWTYRTDRADRLRPHLKTILNNLHNLALSGALTR
ncbi:N-formylglutamate deformylase [Aliiroseovarius crassostreae]|uniref:N-formylglutamate deformylase n=1 Tax=Aliiroseovarius crassostreae TaxID=154981 RepID=UPI0021AF80EB|nr:N-formylglutamate deformylase [Aliiroseovarius crassostreae]UWQ04811.1 N-formylglutamate deformylase [Aliiroseovarius crassostreae]